MSSVTEPRFAPRPDAPPSANGELAARVQQLRLGAAAGAGRKAGGRGAVIPWVLCALLAFTWAGVGVRWYKSSPSAATGPADGGGPAFRPVGQPNAQPPAGSAADAPADGSGSPAALGNSGAIKLTLKGNLIPSLQIAVSPIEVSGRVTEIHFKEGDRKKKGDVLAVLDNTSYLRDHEEAAAMCQAAEDRLQEMLPESVRQIEKLQARAALDEAKAALRRAELEMKRVEGLRGSVAVPQRDIEQAEADLRQALARVEQQDQALAMLLEGPRKEKTSAARSDVVAARARRDRAKWRLDNCVIRAPIDGTVLTKKADIGSLVSPLSFNVAATLCEIADLGQMEVEIDVPERDLQSVRVNQDATIAADAYPKRVYRGRVDRVMPIADDSKNVIKVRVQVVLPPGEEPGAYLKPKMSVTVTLFDREYVAAK